MAKSIIEKVSSLLNKIDVTENKYDRKSEEYQEKLFDLRLKVEEAEKEFVSYQKMKMLGDITEQTFKTYQIEVDVLKQNLQQMEKEAELFNIYKNEDIAGELEEIDKIRPEFNEKQQTEISSIKKEMFEAKKEYLKKLSIIGLKYDQAIANENRLQNIYIKLGRQPSSYVPNKLDILGGKAEVSRYEIKQHL